MLKISSLKTERMWKNAGFVLTKRSRKSMNSDHFAFGVSETKKVLKVHRLM